MANKARRIFATKGQAALDLFPCHPCVREEIGHDEDRRVGGHSLVERIGRKWREAHGFGKPFYSGFGRGKGATYRERQAAREAAAKRKQQKAARVRARAANAMRAVGMAVRKVVHRAARGQ